MDARMDGWMDAWMDGCMDARMDAWMHGWMNLKFCVCSEQTAACEGCVAQISYIGVCTLGYPED